jgi:hypothetical protein
MPWSAREEAHEVVPALVAVSAVALGGAVLVGLDGVVRCEVEQELRRRGPLHVAGLVAVIDDVRGGLVPALALDAAGSERGAEAGHAVTSGAAAPR